MKNTVLVTGAAGFIGYHISKRLLQDNYTVIGFDNLNNYYSVELKKDRIKNLKKHEGFTFVKGSLEDYRKLEKVFLDYKPETVINLAAQAGVRYSIENPRAYIDSNIVGFFNILQCCRDFPINHLIYASSSSVYGTNVAVPFTEEDKTDTPISLYAATKKTDELMAYSYSKLYGIKATGLRFFSVYGPFGRPDMAYYKFTEKILKGEEIDVYNNGEMLRDFTYIDDVVECLMRIINIAPNKDENGAYHKIYNVGSGKPTRLMDFIELVEKYLDKKAKINLLPLQDGDMMLTYAKKDELVKIIDSKPMITLEEGMMKFILWYKKYNS